MNQYSNIKRKKPILFAILALERLEAIVCPLVNRQCTRNSERLAAPGEITDVWLYSAQ